MDFIIDSQGEQRFLGNKIPTKALSSEWQVYGQDTKKQPLVLRTEWNDLIVSNTDPDHPFACLDQVHDQNGAGMCNASATVAGIECARKAAGLEQYIALSGGDLYRRINGGVDRGSMLEDGIEAAFTGVLPVSMCPYLDWRQNHGTDKERAKYKLLEAFLCPTFNHCMSAVLSGFFLISGIAWYSNYTPAKNGWLPFQGTGNWGGHAVLGYKAARIEVNGQTRYGIWHKNSWSKRWGMDGLCVFPETAYSSAIGGWWAVRVVTDEGGSVPAPKPHHIQAA